MRQVKWMMAAGLLAATTAGCATGYSSPAYVQGGHDYGYGYSSPTYYGSSYYGPSYYGSRYYGTNHYGQNYYGQNYYGQRYYQTGYNPRVGAVVGAVTGSRYRDSDGDGVADRWDRYDYNPNRR